MCTNAVKCFWPFFSSSSPKNAVLGHVPGTGLYCDVDEYEEVSLSVWTQAKRFTRSLLVWDLNSLWFVFCYQAAEYEGIKIFHSNSSIYFANSDLYVNALKEKVILATMCVYVCL